MLAGAVAAATIVGGSAAVPASAAPLPARKWQITPMPDVGATAGLVAVSCSTTTSCVAVGDNPDGSTDRSLIETWDGLAWSVTPSPSPGSEPNTLEGVSCLSPTSCVAVGYFDSDGVPQTLVETWDGTNWSLAPSPNPGIDGSELIRVSCVSATACVAVGLSFAGGDWASLIEMWNGSDWSVSAHPEPAHAYQIGLFGVSCTSAVSCFAVGYSNSSLGSQLLLEKWNGTKWSIKTPETPGSANDKFIAVSCAAANRCAAVGYSGAVGGPLIEMWDGTSWSITPSPNPGLAGNEYIGVSCPSRTRCVAVGYSTRAGRRFQRGKTLVETTKGTTWSIVPSASHLGGSDYIQSVSCPTVDECVAVALTYRGSGYQPFVVSGKP